MMIGNDGLLYISLELCVGKDGCVAQAEARVPLDDDGEPMTADAEVESIRWAPRGGTVRSWINLGSDAMSKALLSAIYEHLHTRRRDVARLYDAANPRRSRPERDPADMMQEERL